MHNKFIDLILKNRSYRGFDKTYKVSIEECINMINCARFSASSSNIQPLKFYIATDEIEVAEIQKLTRWAGSLSNLTLPKLNEEPTAFIVVCHDITISNNVDRFLIDVGIVSQSILLSSADQGLGGCMIRSFEKQKLIELLKFNENLIPQLVIALGKPIETIKLVDKEENKDTTYYRDDNGIHYVPKRTLNELIIEH
ncbi:MAG: nitroreductase [Christensenellaceae bacterium]|nr:nitroreductase [Christensenellaceae bacterium]